MAIEIVDLPMKNGDFNDFPLQIVSSPEGSCHDIIWHPPSHPCPNPSHSGTSGVLEGKAPREAQTASDLAQPQRVDFGGHGDIYPVVN